MATTESDRFIGLREAGDRVGLSYWSIRGRVRDGLLPLPHQPDVGAAGEGRRCRCAAEPRRAETGAAAPPDRTAAGLETSEAPRCLAPGRF